MILPAVGIIGVPRGLIALQQAEARQARRNMLKALLECSDEELDECIRDGDVIL